MTPPTALIPAEIDARTLCDPLLRGGNRFAVHLWIKALRQNYQKRISAVGYPRPRLLRPVATSACPSSTEIALDIPSPCHLATCLCSSQLFVCSFQLPTELHIACSGRVQCSSVPSAVSIHGGILGQMAYVPGGLTCVYREMHCVGLQKNI